jgi:mannose-6-phosphate isomerase
MKTLPPLRFRPILRDYLWGGRRLGTELGKLLDNSERAAESWEIVDHDDDQSVVEGGPFAGKTLHQLVTACGADLFGRHFPQKQFPLLFKFLDCQKTLSVQVHPNDKQAAKIEPPDLGKTEAWYVVAAEPGSKVYAGLKPGVDRPTLERALARGACDECLHIFEPQAGECIFIEAGTVHAIGAGLLIAEIQQASDTTYRLFDWNRVDRDGKPRPLHVAEALDVINFERGPVQPIPAAPLDTPGVTPMVECDKFKLDHWQVNKRQRVGSHDQFHIYSVIAGNVSLIVGSEHTYLGRGDTALIPASIVDFEIQPYGSVRFLDMYLP